MLVLVECITAKPRLLSSYSSSKKDNIEDTKFIVQESIVVWGTAELETGPLDWRGTASKQIMQLINETE